jgi:RNA polymerase sigma factor (sigma-70 family)
MTARNGGRKEPYDDDEMFLPLRSGMRLPGLSLLPLLLMRWERCAAPIRLPYMSDATLQTLLDRRAGFLAFVQRRVADPAFAEDILQAAFVRALERSDGLRKDESAVAWFYSVLRNAVVDHYRRRATENRLMEPWADGLDIAEGSVTDASTRTFICGCIQYVLPTLKLAYAEILREVDLEEASLISFAKKHELTPGNAAVRAHRARAALKRELARVCGACSIHACLDCCCKAPAA